MHSKREKFIKMVAKKMDRVALSNCPLMATRVVTGPYSSTLIKVLKTGSKYHTHKL